MFELLNQEKREKRLEKLGNLDLEKLEEPLEK